MSQCQTWPVLLVSKMLEWDLCRPCFCSLLGLAVGVLEGGWGEAGGLQGGWEEAGGLKGDWGEAVRLEGGWRAGGAGQADK